MFKKDIKLLSGTTDVKINLANENWDLFDVKNQADVFYNIITDKSKFLSNIKMISLYGDWGAGKTTFIRYVDKKIKSDKKDDFETIFFEAWKYEFDKNLQYSLIERIFEKLVESTNSETLTHEVVKGIKVCGVFFKKLILNTQVQALGINIDLGAAGKETIEECTYKGDSFYFEVEEFKKNYEKVIDNLLENNKKLIIFIDDLDRCEPENVISLLSSIKHFFSYSNRVQFICAIDKNAVEVALKTRYADCIKASEYLEKLFDLTFNVKKSESIDKVLKYYLLDESIESMKEFFRDIDLLNPRKLIKILNKTNLALQLLKNDEMSRQNIFNTNIEINLLNFSENVSFYKLLVGFIAQKEFFYESFHSFELIENKIESYLNYLKDLNVDKQVLNVPRNVLCELPKIHSLKNIDVAFGDLAHCSNETKAFLVRVTDANCLINCQDGMALDRSLFENRLMDHFIKIGSLPCNNIFDIIQLHKFIENI